MPKAKDFKQCGHCGRDSKELEKNGFTVREIRGPQDEPIFQISCPCGIMTKVCATRGLLKIVWDSRPNKPYKLPNVKITHPAPRGSKQEDTKLTTLGEKSLNPEGPLKDQPVEPF